MTLVKIIYGFELEPIKKIGRKKMLIPAFHTTVSSVVILFNLYGNEKAA
jgi:hypothetical protein